MSQKLSPKAFPFTWVPTWFRPQESTWSLACKLSVANLASLKHIQCELLQPLRKTHQGWLISGGRGDKWLAGLLGIPTALAESAFLDDLVPHRTTGVLMSSHLRYCPECLKRHFHSPLYQYLPLELCPIHNVPLQEGCPHCGTALPGHPLDLGPDTHCLHCGSALIEQPSDWLDAVRTQMDARPLMVCRQRLRERLDNDHIEGSTSQYERNGVTNGSVETLRSYLVDDTERLETNEFMVPELVVPGLSIEESWAALDACRNGLYSVYAQLPNRHADAFHRDYSPSFFERRLALPMGSKAVAAYRLVEDFLGVLAPPIYQGAAPGPSQRRFNKDFFEEHLETADHTERLPISTGTAMAALIVQSLYVDALEYLASGNPDKPWTRWALDQESFKYPVRWFAATTGKQTFQYRVTVVTRAAKRRLQEILSTI